MDAAPDCPVRLVSIGISQGQNEKFGSKFGASDAFALNGAFQRIGGQSVSILTDKAASRAGIEQALAALTQQSRSCDTEVLFFSGYGHSTDDGGFYLYSSDVKSEEDLTTHGISSEVLWAWLEKIQSKNILVILDTGDATNFLAAVLSRSARFQERNVSVIAPQGNSRDDLKLEHGVLSYAVVQALAQESDVDGNGQLSASELEAATSANVVRADAGLTQNRFRARGVSIGADFTIGRFTKPKAAAMRGTQSLAQQNQAAKPALNGKYRALLIATNEYKEWDALANPIPDAEAIAGELESIYGFEKPKVVRNPTKREMSKAITDLRTMQYGPDDELFIFIAGHGTYDKDVKIGFLVAKDSEKDDPGHDTYYSQYELFRNVAAIPAKHVFVVIDACQAGAGLAQITREDPKGDITYKAGGKLDGLMGRKDRRTLIWMTSGGDKYVPDGEGKHSPFAYQLLSALDSGPNDPEGLVTFIDVISYANRVHSPAPQPTYGWMPENDHGSDFWLVAKPGLRGQGDVKR